MDINSDGNTATTDFFANSRRDYLIGLLATINKGRIPDVITNITESKSRFISLDEFFLEILEGVFSLTCIYDSFLFPKGEFGKHTKRIFRLQDGDDVLEAIQLPEPRIGSLSEVNLLAAVDTFRNNPNWQLLKGVYEFAVNGAPLINPFEAQYSAYIYLRMLKHDGGYAGIQNPEVHFINDIAMLRIAIDENDECGYDWSDNTFKCLAAMAGLDVKTVQNAASEGAFIGATGDYDLIALKNWLYSKKGFKRTQREERGIEVKLADVNTSSDFGDFLRQKRESIGEQFSTKRFQSKHYLFNKNTISQLESGLFNLPISTTSAIADAYLLEPKAFLDCVMRVFFKSELAMLLGEV